MSFAELNRSIWSVAYYKLLQANKLDLFINDSKYLILKNCYAIVNINGINFEEFADSHKFIKPNDIRGRYLMDHCAKSLVKKFTPHIILSYGFSDQFCFVIDKTTNFCERNLAILLSVIVSNFTSNYIFNWKNYFKDRPLQYAPTFKGNTLLLPNQENLFKYLITKQHECYILNLNSTLYSALVGEYKRYAITENEMNLSIENCFEYSDRMYKTEEVSIVEEKKMSNEIAFEKIKNEINTIAKINEYLFKEFGINYNNELEIFRKGTLIYFRKSNALHALNKKFDSKFLYSILSKDEKNEHINK